MKKLLVVICMGLTFVGGLMMSGCANVNLGVPGYRMISGGEGAGKTGIDMGQPKYSEGIVGGGEGATKAGLQWPESK